VTTASITPGYAGHPDADLLAQLAFELTPMSLAAIVAFGTQADAESAVGPRVFFIPKTYRAVERTLQPADGNASYEGHRVYDVAVYATDAGGLFRLWAAVVDKLDLILTWTGVEVGETSNPGPVGTGAGNAGFGLTMPVIVKGPIYREVYTPVAAETVIVNPVIVAEANGSGPQSLSPTLEITS